MWNGGRVLLRSPAVKEENDYQPKLLVITRINLFWKIQRTQIAGKGSVPEICNLGTKI